MPASRRSAVFVLVLSGTLAFPNCGDDDNGTSASASQPVSVACSVTPLSGPVPLLVSYVATIKSSTPPNSVLVQYGDGRADQAATSGTHVYDAPGSYGLRVTATVGGESAACSQTITALPQSAGPPNAVPVLRLKTNPNPAKGTAPFDVNFNTCTSSDADGDHLLHVYDYGDGRKTGPLDDCGKDHVYQAGKYTALICITDDRPGHDVCSAVEVVAQ
jgi:hypothetical protein